MLRVFGMLERSCSRKARMSVALRSSTRSCDGARATRADAEHEQQPERIAVGRDRMGTLAKLRLEPVGEEALHEPFAVLPPESQASGETSEERRPSSRGKRPRRLGRRGGAQGRGS